MALARTEEDQLELAVRQHAQAGLPDRLFRTAQPSRCRGHHPGNVPTLRPPRGQQPSHPRVFPPSVAARTSPRFLPTKSLAISVSVPPQPPGNPCEPALWIIHPSQFPPRSQHNKERLIPALPRRLRDVVTLSAIEEMLPADVAAVLEISEAAMRSRLGFAPGSSGRARQLPQGRSSQKDKPPGRRSMHQP